MAGVHISGEQLCACGVRHKDIPRARPGAGRALQERPIDGVMMKRTRNRMSPRPSHVAGMFLVALILAAGSKRPEPLFAQGGARIAGAGISKVGRDTRKLTA